MGMEEEESVSLAPKPYGSLLGMEQEESVSLPPKPYGSLLGMEVVAAQGSPLALQHHWERFPCLSLVRSPTKRALCLESRPCCDSSLYSEVGEKSSFVVGLYRNHLTLSMPCNGICSLASKQNVKKEVNDVCVRERGWNEDQVLVCLRHGLLLLPIFGLSGPRRIH